MRPMVAAAAALLVLLPGCRSDRVELWRGPLGPAEYSVEMRVAGTGQIPSEIVTAGLSVTDYEEGARLELDFGGEQPVTTELTRRAGRLTLETVGGVPPGSAGEADLASLVGQLDPPLPPSPLRLGDSWSSEQQVSTEMIEADLVSDLHLVRYRRIGGLDVAEISGTVRGHLRTSPPGGALEGAVSGHTWMAWALRHGRIAASETRLEWSIRDLGQIVVETEVRPRS